MMGAVPALQGVLLPGDTHTVTVQWAPSTAVIATEVSGAWEARSV